MSSEKKTILIADDTRLIRNLLKKTFENDYNVFAEEDGMKAVQTFITHQDEIDIIILDYEMPELDGYKVLQVIRSKREDVPVIFLSGTLDEKRVAKLHRLGVKIFLQNTLI